MTAMEALNDVENGLSKEMLKHSSGQPAEYWRDSTRNGLALASEIVNAVKLKAAIQLGLSAAKEQWKQGAEKNDNE